MSKRAWVGVMAGVIAVAASGGGDKRGAKAIFVDTTSGAVVQGSKPQTGRRAQTGSRNNRRVEPTKAENTPVVAGLMYFIELVSPSGQKSRVTADHSFRSGDRILLHVYSSVDGDVAVLQRNPDGSGTQLFPDPRVNGGSAFIAKKVDTVLPSPTAWFRFDDQPGIENLLIVLRPRTVLARPPSTPTASMSYDDLRSGKGSKGLVLETENTGTEQATYVIRPMGDDAGEAIVVPIALRHH